MITSDDILVILLGIMYIVDQYQIYKLEKKNKELTYKLIGKE